MRINKEFYIDGKDKNNFLILPKIFESSGWYFEEIQRKNDICIFKKKKNDHKNWTFEVIKIQFSPEFQMAEGVTIPAKQTFPVDSLWGQEAFSYMDLPSAQNKFQELINKNS